MLIISCSKRKVATCKPLPAIDLYDGPYYRILRKLRREQSFNDDLDVFIISAKYGLICSDNIIESYDLKMDRQRAKELQPILTKKVIELIKSGRYSELFINLGSTYRDVVREYKKDLPTTIKVIEAEGEIGQRISAMKRWLLGTLHE